MQPSGLQQRIDFMNRIVEQARQAKDYTLWNVAQDWRDCGIDMAMKFPEIGLAATICIGTDRHGATITRVGRGRVWVKRNRAIRTDKNGLSEDQRYIHVIDEKEEEEQFFWAPTRKRYVNSSYYLSLGHRSSYRDPSF